VADRAYQQAGFGTANSSSATTTPSARGVLQPLHYPGDVEPLIAAWFSERQTICISQPTRTVP